MKIKIFSFKLLLQLMVVACLAGPLASCAFFTQEEEDRSLSFISPNNNDFLLKAQPIIYFQPYLATLSLSAMQKLQQQASCLLEHPFCKILIAGYTAYEGSADYNIALGQKRAVVVRDFLLHLGVAKDRMKIISYGSEYPEAINTEDWQKNCRVETKLLNCPKEE